VIQTRAPGASIHTCRRCCSAFALLFAADKITDVAVAVCVDQLSVTVTLPAEPLAGIGGAVSSLFATHAFEASVLEITLLFDTVGLRIAAGAAVVEILWENAERLPCVGSEDAGSAIPTRSLGSANIHAGASAQSQCGCDKHHMVA